MLESYSLFPYFLENQGRILFLVSLLFVALSDPFDPYSPFKFLIFLLILFVHEIIASYIIISFKKSDNINCHILSI